MMNQKRNSQKISRFKLYI